MTIQPTIHPRSFFIMTTMFTIGTSILISPSGMASIAKQDAWMASIVGVALNVLCALLYVALGDRYPRQTFVQYSRSALGAWAGTAVGLLFVLFLILLCSLMLGDVGVFITSQIIEETPTEVVKILYMAVIIFGLRLGLKVFSLAAEMYFLLGMSLLVMLIVTLAYKYKFENLLPLMEFGIKPIIEGGINFSSLQEMVVLLMIYPYVAGRRARKQGLVFGTLLGGFALIVITASSVLVMGASLTAAQFFPAYLLARHVTLGQFFERLEGMMMFIWILTMYVKITITFFAATVGVSQLFGIRDERPLMWPLAIFVIVLALVCYPNVLYVHNMLATVWPAFSYVFLAAFPGLLLLVGALRKQHGDHLTAK